MGPLGTAATNMSIVPATGDYEETGGMIGVNRSKTCPSAALSITNPTSQIFSHVHQRDRTRNVDLS
jgi:hypothetical protein